MLRASASSLKVTSVYGHDGNNENSRIPSCTLVEVDGIHVLLDCGWDISFSTSYIEALLPILPKIDAVLLSSGEFSCCGALPVAVKYMRPQVPIYATIAANKLALLSCIGQYQNRHANTLEIELSKRFSVIEKKKEQLLGGGTSSKQHQDDATLLAELLDEAGGDHTAAMIMVQAMKQEKLAQEEKQAEEQGGEKSILKTTIDDIYHAYADVKDAPYGGTAKIWPLSVLIAKQEEEEERGGAVGRGTSDWSTATEIDAQSFRAGRVLGGCGWRLQYQTDDIVYMPRFTIQSSVHLKGMELRGANAIHLRTNLLIADSSAIDTKPPADSTTKTEETFFNKIQEDLRHANTILFPVESCGRGVEVLMTLDRIFESKALYNTYSLIFAFSKSKEIIDRVKTLTEFLVEKSIADDFLTRVQFVHSAAEALAADSSKGFNSGKCIIADGLTLEDGVAAELMTSVAPMKRGTIIFTSDPPAGSQAAKLVSVSASGKKGKLEGKIWKRRLLEGAELDEYYDKLEEDRVKEAELADRIEAEEQYLNQRLANERMNVNGGGDSDDEGKSKKTKADAALKNLFLPLHLQNQPPPKFLMFPNTHKKKEPTLYGIPLTQLEVKRMRRVVPLRQFTDLGPEDQNFDDETSARVLDSRPSAVRLEKFSVKVAASCLNFSNLFAEVDGESFRQLFRTHFNQARRIVFTAAAPLSSNANALEFLETEVGGHSMETLGAANRAGGIASLKKFVTLKDFGQTEQLAISIQSYGVRLEKNLFHETESQLCSVKEDHGGQWDIGWIAGRITHQHAGAAHQPDLNDDTNADDSNNRRGKRNREDENKLPFLVGVDHRNEDDAAVPIPNNQKRRESNLDAGSVFVGQVNLAEMKDQLRSVVATNGGPRGGTVTTHGKAPMMIVDGNSFVRVPDQFGGLQGVTQQQDTSATAGSSNQDDVTIEQVASQQVFKVRKQVYKHFKQIL